MAFSIVLAILAVIGLGIVFGVAYKIKGIKIAFIASGIALVGFAVLYAGVVYAITSMM